MTTRTRPMLRDAAVLAGLLAGSCALQFSFRELDGVDGFFHILAAAHVADGIRGEMPWLPLTVFADGWVDHQLLFHAALAPFAWLLPPVTAAKLGAAVLAALAGFALYRLQRALGTPAPLLFAVAPFALSWTFWARLEMPRTQSLSLVLLVAALWAMLRGRHGALAAIAWLYAWTYHVSAVLLPIAALYLGVAWLVPGDKGRRRTAWRAPLAAAGGLLAGLTIHPHSPRTLGFLWHHVVLKVLNRDALPVGPEWLAGGPGWLLRTAGLGLAALVAAGVLLWLAGRPSEGTRGASRAGVLLALVALGATAGAWFANKFVEYSVPLSTLALAAALQDAAATRGWALAGRRRALAWGTAAALLAALLVHSGVRVRTAVQDHFHDPDRAAAAMAWLGERAPAGARIYHFAWSHFPELALHGPQYGYIVGLDPHFLAWRDRELWELYEKIGAGWGSNPSRPIRERFGCDWAVLLLPYPGAEVILDADAGLRRAYTDEGVVIYEVVGGGGGPPLGSSTPGDGTQHDER